MPEWAGYEKSAGAGELVQESQVAFGDLLHHLALWTARAVDPVRQSQNRQSDWPKSSRRLNMPSKNKPLTDAELDVYQKLVVTAADIEQSIAEMKAGQVKPVNTSAIEARMKTGLSQSEFARLLRCCAYLQGWEQGRKHPSGAAKTLLAIAKMNPDALLEASKSVFLTADHNTPWPCCAALPCCSCCLRPLALSGPLRLNFGVAAPRPAKHTLIYSEKSRRPKTKSSKIKPLGSHLRGSDGFQCIHRTSLSPNSTPPCLP